MPQSITFTATNTPVDGTTILTSASVSSDLLALITDYNLTIGSNKIAQNAVLGAALGTAAILLGSPTPVVANQGSITTIVDLTGLSQTVTVPAGGRSVLILGFVNNFSNSGATGTTTFMIFEGATKLNGIDIPNSVAGQGAMVMAFVSAPLAGSHTYKLRAQTSAGTTSMNADANDPATLVVICL